MVLLALMSRRVRQSSPDRRARRHPSLRPSLFWFFPRLKDSGTIPFRPGFRRSVSKGSTRGFSVDASEDAAAFTDDSLLKYKAVVFLSTTGDVLNAAQQAAFERFIRRGGGFVGVHSAADTEYDWPFYGGLVGAYFAGHPEIQSATIQIEDPAIRSTASLPRPWIRRDEWYNFRRNPRGSVTVLATLDERTYTGGTMSPDHPDHVVPDLRRRPLVVHRRRPHVRELLRAAVRRASRQSHSVDGRCDMISANVI